MSTPPNIPNIADYKNKFVIFEVNTSREKMHVFERNVRILDVSAGVKSDGMHREMDMVVSQKCLVAAFGKQLFARNQYITLGFAIGCLQNECVAV